MTAAPVAPMRWPVGRIRHFIHGHVPVAWLLIALTLFLKLAVPVGFMPDIYGGTVVLILCDGIDHSTAEGPMVHGMAGHHHHHHGPQKPDAPCPFAGLTAPTLGGADPIQLAIAIVAIITAALFLAAAAPVRTVAYLRPPLRGPPARS